MKLSATFEDFYNLYREYVKVKPPGDLARSILKLSEEVGEVSEAASAVLGSKTKIKKIAKDGQSPRDRMIEELADVFIVINNVSLLSGITTDELIEAGIAKMNKRMKND